MSAPVEDLAVSAVHDVYPGIDPEPYRDNQTYAGKVVLITGASRGIGQETALQYARSGATVSLIARRPEVLAAAEKAVKEEIPHAKVATFVADVSDVKAIEAAVKGTVKAFGRIDIAIANAGKGGTWTTPMTKIDPDEWWKTIDTNVRGTYNLAHFAVPELAKTKGYFIIVSSMAAQVRMPNASDYVISKHALNRLAEFIPIENPDVKAFSIHPGAIRTDMGEVVPQLYHIMIDTLELAACTMLRLTSGRDDWLSGRYVSATWNLDEVERNWKEKILQQEALVNRLHIPN